MDDNLKACIADLQSAEPARQLAAAEKLSQLGCDARPAAVALVKACEVPDESTRELVVAALEELGPPAAANVAPLAALVKNPSLDVAYWSATLLGRLQGEAAPAVQALVDALAKHPEPAVRQRAAWALGQIGPPANAARQSLEQAAAGSDRRLATLAAEALRNISG